MVVLEEFHSDSLPRYLGICFLIGMVPTNWGRTWTGGLINHRSHVWVVAYVPQIGSQFFVGECCARGIRCTFEISSSMSVFSNHWVTHYWVNFWIWFYDSPLTSLMPSLPFPRYRPCCAHLRYLVVQCTHVWYLLIACLLAAFICSYSFLFASLYFSMHASITYLYGIMRSAPWGFQVAQFRVLHSEWGSVLQQPWRWEV